MSSKSSRTGHLEAGRAPSNNHHALGTRLNLIKLTEFGLLP